MYARASFVSVLLAISGCTEVTEGTTRADLLTSEQYALIEAEEGVASRGMDSGSPADDGARGGPRIVIAQPDMSRPLVSPVRVALRFEPSPGARVVPESFTVKYKKGFLSLDITEQALQFMRVTADGATAREIPIRKAGLHTLVIEVSDTEQRTGRQALTFEIVGSH